MWKRLNIILLFLLIEKCLLTSHFLISSERELMLVPSVAFRHHSATMELTALAQASDDWILYIQGDTFILLLIKKITSQYSRMVF
jgi:hypothetical protein